MGKKLKIKVCKDCFEDPDGELRKALKDIKKNYKVKVVKKDCLDVCEDEPVIKVGGKTLAPATPKKLRKAVKKRI